MNDLNKVLISVSIVLACAWAGCYVYSLEYDWYIGPLYLTLGVIGIPAVIFTACKLEDMGIL